MDVCSSFLSYPYPFPFSAVLALACINQALVSFNMLSFKEQLRVFYFMDHDGFAINEADVNYMESILRQKIREAATSPKGSKKGGSSSSHGKHGFLSACRSKHDKMESSESQGL